MTAPYDIPLDKDLTTWGRQEELETLRTKLEKIETERSLYKTENERLETKKGYRHLHPYKAQNFELSIVTSDLSSIIRSV
ncbi:hypothetical protein EVAR_76897_1 [Eumeta japonica]|uniref:Uncharacterized protein n=1 Tax=Eumeta variegata TaxID=151549 RepID=A0A4C1SHF3_EUMVA|nr:hypothetical protein EVAR_76897_1 [Eumeta japonica]